MPWTIYCHTHIQSGRRYVGLTKQAWEKRWKNHVHAAKHSKNGRWHFPNAIRKYGPEAFSHEVLEICHDLEVANAAERRWISHYETTDPVKGFNLAKGGAHTPHPVDRSYWDDPDRKARILAATKAGLNTPESKAKRSAISKALMASPTRQKISEAMKEQASTPEGRAQRIKSSHPGKVLSEEHRAKIKASSRNKEPEVRANISAGVQKAFADPKVKARIGKAVSAAYVDPAVKLKVSESNWRRSKFFKHKDEVLPALAELGGDRKAVMERFGISDSTLTVWLRWIRDPSRIRNMHVLTM